MRPLSYTWLRFKTAIYGSMLLHGGIKNSPTNRRIPKLKNRLRPCQLARAKGSPAESVMPRPLFSLLLHNRRAALDSPRISLTY
jgi:hypothetical protein